MNKRKILLLEDEINLAQSLKIILTENDYEVTICHNGVEGLLTYNSCDLLLLDLMLPDMNGLDILKDIRKESSTYPILIISAKSTEDDLLTGLNLGADDYITKPFSVKELLLRIKRTFERLDVYAKKNLELNLENILFGENSIDVIKLEAQTLNGIIPLTRQEIEILSYLYENKNKVVSRGDLIKHIWGHNRDIESRTLDNFIVRFRKYFEKDPQSPIHFITKRGLGYQFKL